MVRNIPKGLMLRSGVYYFRQDVKNADGKYKSIRVSLRTKDLGIALRRLETMKKFMRDYDELTPEEKTEFAKYYSGGELTQIEDSTLEKLRNKDMLVRFFYDQWMAHHADLDELIGTIVENAPIIDLCKKGMPDTALERYNKTWQAATDTIQARALLDLRMQKDIGAKNKFNGVMGFLKDSVQYKSWEEYVASKEEKTPVVMQPVLPVQQPVSECPAHTIRAVMEDMFEQAKTKKATCDSRRLDIENMVKAVGCNLEDDYSKIDNPEIISKICQWIKNRTSKNGAPIKNNRKNKMLGILKLLVLHAEEMEPEHYKAAPLTRCIKTLRKDTKGNTSGYHGFTSEMLSNIFDPKHDFFKNYPEQFMACLIALFSGSRTNAATTLQFKNIRLLDGMYVIDFLEDHDKKQLKTEESERSLPIAQQLLDWGFVDIIKQRQEKINAKPEQFIFTKMNDYDDKKASNSFIKSFHRFLREIGVENTDQERYSFHSFRDTVSKKLETVGVSDDMAHKLVGWKGVGTRSEYYLKRTQGELKEAVDKLVYSEEELHLQEWKDIIKDRYVNQEKYPTPKGRKPNKQQD